MATPFDILIRMLEQRLERQNEALCETKAQLDAARRSQVEFQKSLK